MTPDQLLRECEQLTHKERMYRMVELGRTAFSDESINGLLAAFMKGNVYQRLLAVQSCYGSHDSTLALQGAVDPSRSVRALSLALVALYGSDAEVQTVLTQVPFAMQESLVYRLRRLHRQLPIDGYLEILAVRKDPVFNRMLSFGSRELVLRYLDLDIEHFELPDWQRLARQHPELVVERLCARASTTNAADYRVLYPVNAVLFILSDIAPDLALELVHAFVPYVGLSSLRVQKLALHRPNEIADLVIQSDAPGAVSFNRAVRKLTTERLLTLYTRFPQTIQTSVLRKLTPQQRVLIYEACHMGWRSSNGTLAYDIVACLPTTQRVQEARRHLVLSELETRILERLRYATFLPWEEIYEQFATTLRSPDADLRGATLRALLGAVRYQRSYLPQALQLVLERRNEQDPVRLIMLNTLAGLPYGMWQTQHLNDLAQIIRDALNARDLSPASANSIERLVIRLLPFHPDWCAQQLPVIYRERGMGTMHRLQAYISDADTRRIAPHLVPVLQAWLERENDGHLIALAGAFGRRLGVFTELVSMLEVILQRTPTQSYVTAILSLFAQYCRELLATLVPKMLEQDKSSIVLSVVYHYLHRFRQDLLTPYLGQHAYAGRFTTGQTRFVLSLYSGFFRWTPRQQTTFARTLLEVAQDDQRPTIAIMRTLNQLVAMPAIDPAFVIQFASDEREPVRDTALQLLGKLDGGQGIPVLIEALGDDRARVAIYALRSSLLALSPDEVLNILSAAPMKQITVAKEVVRLIGEMETEEAYRLLLQFEHDTELHRDVRVALLRALWSYVERDETWEIFERAACWPDAGIARGVVRIPADGMSEQAQQRLLTLLATLLAHPLTEVRIATLERCVLYPLSDPQHVLLASLLKAMNSRFPDEVAQAARAVFAIYTNHDPALIGNTLRKLLPNRRSLRTVIYTFTSSLSSARSRFLPTTRALLSVLSEDRLTLGLQISLIIDGLPWDEVATELIKRVDYLHADALEQAGSMIHQSYRRPDADLDSFEEVLAASNDERLRRLALSALVAGAHRPTGWSEERIARLQTYQQDPSPLIAETAQFTFVPLS
jgi:hypothetical protein